MPVSSPNTDLEICVRADGPIALDVRADCPGGELLAIVGPSGSGKTTLLKTVAGLLRPHHGHVRSAGEVWFDAQARIDLPPHARRVGYVPQSYGLFPHLTAEQNIEAGLGHVPRLQRRTEAARWLAKVGLGALAERRPSRLSGGQQQRVALARALARRPSAVLLDEPFSAVDAETREALRAEIDTLRRALRLPIVMVTHDLGEALWSADRLLLLGDGKGIQYGRPSEVLARPASAMAARMLGYRNILPARVLDHDLAAGRSWVACGEAHLPVALRADLRRGQPVQCLVPESAIELAPDTHRDRHCCADRLRLTIARVHEAPDEARVLVHLPGLPALLQLSLRAGVARPASLAPGMVVDGKLDPRRIVLLIDGGVESSTCSRPSSANACGSTTD